MKAVIYSGLGFLCCLCMPLVEKLIRVNVSSFAGRDRSRLDMKANAVNELILILLQHFSTL